ncbi:MAG TPA: hypothetical protein DEG71_09540 [Clostridiales bacterium]|nr:hypothetical protein [Clostridiales bacterium]
MNDGLDILGLDEVEIENTSVEEIDNESVNLIFVGIDGSGSMSGYVSDMKKSLNDFKDALLNSKEVDEILVARADFADRINVGGYKKVNEFDIAYSANGMTALYDVVVEGKEKLTNYMTFLKNQGMRVKAVFAVFSDGDDTSSRRLIADAKNSVKYLNDEEITTAFISFGGGATGIAKTLGFKNILPVGGSASELRKAFNCLSKSVIESSKAVVNSTDDFFTM